MLGGQSCGGSPTTWAGEWINAGASLDASDESRGFSKRQLFWLVAVYRDLLKYRRMIELPRQDPCEICETLAGRSTVPVLAESELTITVVNPWQFEAGQCCVVTRRHVATLLELTDQEGTAVIKAARDVAQALLASYQPLGILTFQNNGVYSGQEVPHYHFHVVPRQPGSDWGIGPPQLHKFPDAGRVAGATSDPASEAERRRRARVDAEALHNTAAQIRTNMPRADRIR